MGGIHDKEYWMGEALKAAEAGMENGELPIGAVLVGGDEEIAHEYTHNNAKNSVIAHAELFALLDAHKKIFSCARPLVLYTTLEPCIMCIGAAIESGVDKIVYSMDAPLDGGSCYADKLRGVKEKVPEIEGGVLADKALPLMQKFVDENPNHPGWEYAKSLI
jgi:tRNA(adenine34) deaminase